MKMRMWAIVASSLLTVSLSACAEPSTRSAGVETSRVVVTQVVTKEVAAKPLPATKPTPAPTKQAKPTTKEVVAEPVQEPTPEEELTEAAGAVMPDVQCMNLQDAQDTIQAAGVFYSRSIDASGQGRNQVLDRNWIVVGQSPSAGSSIDEGEAVLSVVKIGEDNSC